MIAAHYYPKLFAYDHLVANYGDYTCTPASVWIVYNSIPHENKSMEVKQGCTHGYEMKNCMRFVVTPKGIKIK